MFSLQVDEEQSIPGYLQTESTGEKEFVEPLMLFNARRGGELHRLGISQWLEAMNGDWIDEID